MKKRTKYKCAKENCGMEFEIDSRNESVSFCPRCGNLSIKKIGTKIIEERIIEEI